MKGLFAWVGFPTTTVLYDRAPRDVGETKWNYWKLWNFALEGITSFTVMPLKVATYLGAGGGLAIGDLRCAGRGENPAVRQSGRRLP